MLLEGYNILRPDRRRDIPHSQGRVIARRANNNYWGDVSVCKTQDWIKAWRAHSLVFCKRAPLIVFQCAPWDSWQPTAGPDWQSSTSIYTALPIGTSQPRARPRGPKAFTAVQGQPFYHCNNRQAQNPNSLLAPMGSKGFNWKMLIPFNKMTFLDCTLLVLMRPPARVGWLIYLPGALRLKFIIIRLLVKEACLAHHLWDLSSLLLHSHMHLTNHSTSRN